MTEAQTRHEKQKAATRQALMEATKELIAERGYNNVEILDITERADVSKATFYQHFANKEACLHRLIIQGFDSLVEHIMEGGRTAPSKEEWAYTAFWEAFSWAEANRSLPLVMVGGAASTDLNMFGRSYMVSIIERAMGEFDPVLASTGYSVHLKAHVITGVLIQLLGWWLENDTGYSAEEMAKVTVDVLVNGIGLLTS